MLIPLRDDLEIHEGMPYRSGAPGWVVYDPVRHRFFQIGRRTLKILSHWSAGSPEAIRARLEAEDGPEVSDDDINAVGRFLSENQLLEGGSRGSAARYAEMERKVSRSKALRTIQRLMFVRIPLVRPHRFLKATWPFVRLLFTRTFVAISMLMLVAGLFLASRQAAEVEAHFRQAFTWAGSGSFLIAIVFIKICHELGHAYQAVSRGLRVPVMGIAFFAFLPLLFTDVSDAWRLKRRRDRIMIDMGGVIVELFVAIYATLVWSFLPDGALRTVTFAIATSGWISSLFVNLNPLMRFDGYYLMSDTLGIQNLQPRAFAIGKWAMRRLLFALDDRPPENFDKPTLRLLIVYAWAVWVYRLLLFSAISLLLYTTFFKVAGVILFVVAITSFILRPLFTELRFWWSKRKRIMASPRSFVTLTFFVGLLALLFWPMSTPIYIPAILEESHQQDLFPAQPAQLETVFVKEGDMVAPGDPLFQFWDPELPARIGQAQTRIALQRARLLSIAGDADDRAETTVVERLLEEELETLAALQDRVEKLLVVAKLDGQVRELSPDLTPGAWYPREEVLGRVIAQGAPVVRGLVSETDLEQLDFSRGAEFVAEELAMPIVRLQPLSVANFSVDELKKGYLARPHGGPIPVSTDKSKALSISGSWYPVSGIPATNISDGSPAEESVLRGVIVTRSLPQSLAHRAGNRVATVLIREMGL